METYLKSEEEVGSQVTGVWSMSLLETLRDGFSIGPRSKPNWRKYQRYKTKVGGSNPWMASRPKPAASTPTAPNPVFLPLKDWTWLLLSSDRDKGLHLLRSRMDSERQISCGVHELLTEQWLQFQRGTSMSLGATFERRQKTRGFNLQSLPWQSPSTQWFSPLN